MNKLKPILVVGAGFAGTVIANVLAETGKYRVTVIDQRPHIGGNAYDCICPQSGVRYQPYGPHIFHTNNDTVFRFLSRFTEWIPYRHRVRAYVDGTGTVPIPINRDTLNLLYDSTLDTKEDVVRFLDRIRIRIKRPANALEFLHSIYGPDLTELFFAPYTRKMWNLSLVELPVSVVARLPVRYDDNPYYFNDKYQALPARGYSHLFHNMLSHPNIDVFLSTQFDRLMLDRYSHCFNSMSIDEYYDYRYDELPYRTIEFENTESNFPYLCDVPVVNFTDRKPYTRCTRWSLFPSAGTEIRAKITFERPTKFIPSTNERYYPVKTTDGEPQRRFKLYQSLSKDESRLTFIGRCGQYIYYDMHQVVANSLKLARQFIRNDRR